MLADAVGLSLRARERCITRFRVVIDQTPADHYLDPILVALLIVLRSNKPDLFSRVVSGEASAETVMEYLYSLPNGEEFRTGRAGIIIDAYLIVSDPNHDRRQKRMAQLNKEATGRKLPGVQQHASDLLDMIGNLKDVFRGEIRLVSVAKKIDLAAMVKPQ